MSLLNSDISTIIKESKDVIYKPFISIYPIIHTEKKDIFASDGVFIDEILEYRDYKNNFSDYIEIKLTIYQGTFYYDIYPYLKNIEITINREKFMREKSKPLMESERYKAVFLLDKNPILNQNITATRSELNNFPPLTITLQLLDRSAETIRIKTVQGNFDNKVAKSKSLKVDFFLKSIYTEQCNKILIDNKPSIECIEIEKPNNQADIVSLVIPSGTQLINVANFTQRSIGVYSFDIGLYLQRYKNKKTIFIYSLYTSKKFDDNENKIIFYIPNTNSFSLAEKTYNLSNNVLKIVTLPNTSIQDSLDTKFVSEGTGFKVANASSFMRKPIDVTEKGPKFKKTGLNTELVLEERADGLNFAKKPKKSISSNPFVYISETRKNKDAYIMLTWSNSYSDTIFPGAACKIYFESKEKINELSGIIHKVVTKYSNRSQTPLMNLNRNTSVFSSETQIEIFIDTLEVK